MAERDYRLTYRTRGVDDDDRYDGSRQHLPTALDPYLYPEDRDELKRNVAMVKERNRRYYDDPGEYEAPRRANTTRDDYSTRSVKYDSRPVGRAATYDDGATTVSRENVRRGTVKTTYSVTQGGLEKESEVGTRPRPSASARNDDVPHKESSSRQQVVREHDEIEVERKGQRGKTRYREYDEIDVDIERSRAPSKYAATAAPRYDDREYSRRDYEVERPRPQGGAYVIDAREDDILDIYVGGRPVGADRGFGGYRNDPYEDDARSGYSRAPPRNSGYDDRKTVYAERDQVRSSTSSLHGGAPYASGARPVERSRTAVAASKAQANYQGYSRAPTRVEETDYKSAVVSGPRPGRDRAQRGMARAEEDEYGFIKEERIVRRETAMSEDSREPFGPDPSLISGRGRERADTFEEDYVIVPAPRRGTATSEANTRKTSDTLRSAMIRDDTYTLDERLRRRRSRSISFPDAQVAKHDAGDRFHEQPGAEAAMSGKYLRHYEVDDNRNQERMDSEYSEKVRRDVKGSDKRGRDTRYVEEDRYGPQRMRSKSRRRKEEDDESYVSRNYEKVVKTTYY